MTNHTLSPRKIIMMLCAGAALVVAMTGFWTAAADEPQLPKPLIVSQPKETIEERMARKIALDVRDMNIVDVLKFLAMKGEFNVVISPSVDGRSTVLLDNVAIKDALDIVAISSRLAYSIQNNIVQVMTSAEYEAMFGKQFSDKTVVATFRLQYAKPSYVLAALDNMKSNVGKIIIDEDTGAVVLIDTPDSIEKMKKVLADIEQPLETVVYNLQYAQANVVADKLRARIDAKSVGSISADERSNQLVVRVFPGRKDEVEKIVRHLDEPTKEVLIEARILQVIFKPSYDAGIDWNIASSNKANPNLQFKNIFLDKSGMSSTDNLSTTFGQIAVGNINADRFAFNIRAMEQVSDTKLLSNPKIMAVNNEESRIHIGDTVPYIISTVSGTGDNAITSEDVRFIDVGLKLNVTPTINDDGMITMKLRPEISSVVDKITSKGGGIPQVNKTEVETTLVVEDGTTIIMAGLRKDDKIHSKKGLPILMDLPYVNKLFSRESDSISSSEIVIFITPHILTGKENYKAPDGAIKPSKAYNK
ncbi:MAG: secretin N-terminal domain-containing protein [Candidatus Omnitrophota bacterium]